MEKLQDIVEGSNDSWMTPEQEEHVMQWMIEYAFKVGNKKPNIIYVGPETKKLLKELFHDGRNNKRTK